ncbi:MAG: peptidylprolyl isomerase [Caldisericia bacterium]|nr:peptidylprolyl isomerase [Caldisericia bacterium]
MKKRFDIKNKKKKILKFLIFFIVILIIFIIGYFKFINWWRKESQIAARVGNDIITYEDLENRVLLNLGLENIYSSAFQDRYLTIRKQILEEIIEDSLVMKYAIEKGYSAPQKIEGFDEYTENDKIRKFYVSMIENEIMNEISKKLKEEELLKYYNDNKIEFIKLKAQVIYISSNKGDPDYSEKEKKINEAYTKILRGVPFEKVVQEYSDEKENNGITEYFDVFKYIGPVNEVIFNLKIGEISKPIITIKGFYIFKILDRIEGYEKFKDVIKERYLKYKTNIELANLKENLKYENESIIQYGNKVEKLINWYNKVLLGKGG